MDQTQRYLFLQGNCGYAYRFMGAHKTTKGYRFAVWAPQAYAVSVVGEFNGWDHTMHPMECQYGVWQCEIEGIEPYASYKYAVSGESGWILKADPYGFHAETRPHTASKVFDLEGYDWKDAQYLSKRAASTPHTSPINIYEVHLGSWKLDEEERLYTYARMANELVPYVKDMGYTHVELLPVMEHPLDISWGYQVTGFFSANSRFGTPHDLMHLIDCFHQANIGVILDWVPAHFPRDEHGLRRFDGTPCYEYADPRRGENAEWGTCMFDCGRNEVRSFLKSSAMFWMDQYHADGLRVDAVSFMIYHDYGRSDGQWLPNVDGGNENYEAISLLKEINIMVYRDFPGVIMAAEEATAYPKVTAPVHEGGLGFGFKWNMGWMHDVLDYMALDPVHRKHHHSKMTFSLHYAFSENYILPFSHDEVVHGKKSMLDKMPGDIWQKFASLRALLGYMFAHPGKKLGFMGYEFGQFIEWRETAQLDWFLLLYEKHPEMQTFVRRLNHLYCDLPPLYEVEDSWEGFCWCNANDADHSVFSFVRTDKQGKKLLCVCNFTPVYWEKYRVGLPHDGVVRQVLNTDEVEFGGSGKGNGNKPLHTEHIQYDGHASSVQIALPPLSCVYYALESEQDSMQQLKRPANKTKKVQS